VTNFGGTFEDMAAQVPPTIIGPPRGKHVNRDEVHRLESLGLLTGRYELIEGELVDKMGHNAPHAYVVRLMFLWIVRVLGGDRAQCQLPIEVAVDDQQLNEPLPDIAALRVMPPELKGRHPRGDELLLVVEVGDSSVRFDLTVKADLYARAGVPEYWVVDIPNRMLVVHRHPEKGAYRQVEGFNEAEMVSFGGANFQISSFLP
jgi:Uma2 family endonuclease